MWTFRTIVLPVELADQARDLCMALTGSASEGMFTTPLYTGETVSRTVSSGYIATEFAEMLPCDGEGGNPEALMDLLSSVGTEVPTEQLEQLLSMIDISEEEAYVAIDRLGLSMSGGVYESLDESPALPE